MTMPAADSRHSCRSHALAALAAAVLTGLAAGTGWALATLCSGSVLDGLALPLAWLLAMAGRHWAMARGPALAGLVLLSCAIALATRLGLLAVLAIGGAAGCSLSETLHKAGAGLILQVVRLRLDPHGMLYYAAGLVLAGWLSWRRPR